MQAPHDFRITLPYAADEGRGQAYLPFRVAWYTKQFTLPTEWAGRTSYLVFRGTMRSARVYLDGVEVAFHPLAYVQTVSSTASPVMPPLFLSHPAFHT